MCIRTYRIEQIVNFIVCWDKIFPFRFFRILRYPLYSYTFIDIVTFRVFTPLGFPEVVSTATTAAYVFSTLSNVIFVAFPIFSSTKSVSRLSIFFSFSPTFKLSIFSATFARVRKRIKLSLSFCSTQLLQSSMAFIPSSLMPVIAAGESCTFRSQMHVTITCHTSITLFVCVNGLLASFTIFPHFVLYYFLSKTKELNR